MDPGLLVWWCYTFVCVTYLIFQYFPMEKGPSMRALSAVQIRGNLRAKREDVLSLVAAGVEKHFGEAAPAFHVYLTYRISIHVLAKPVSCLGTQHCRQHNALGAVLG